MFSFSFIFFKRKEGINKLLCGLLQGIDSNVTGMKKTLEKKSVYTLLLNPSQKNLLFLQ